MKTILSLLSDGTSVSFPRLSMVTIKGADAEQFLQGQLTQNIKEQSDNSFFTSSRLDSKGRIKFNLLVKKVNSESFNFYVDPSIYEQVLKDLDQFIIMEDVTLEYIQEVELTFHLGHQNNNATIFGVEGLISDENMTSEIDYSTFELVTGHYQFFKQQGASELLTNTISCETALDLSKGCFVGQEVVSKVMVNRGAGNYPYLIISKEKLNDELRNKEGSKVGKKLTDLHVGSTVYFAISSSP